MENKFFFKAKYRNGQLVVTINSLTGSELFGLSVEEKWAAIIIMSMGQVTNYSPGIFSIYSGLAEDKVAQLWESLKTRGLIVPYVETGGSSRVSPFHPELADSLADLSVTIPLQERWVKIFKDKEWIEKEIMKAIAWNDAQTVKKKVFSKFLNNWLNRASDRKEPVSQGYGYLE